MKNVQLYYSGTISKVRSAVEKANEILCSEELYEMIKVNGNYDNSNLSSETLTKLMQESGHEIEVSVNWIVPIVNNTHDKIVLSGWDFSSELGFGVNMLINETVCSIDRLHELLNRNGQQRPTRYFTAPYIIGAIAQNMVVNNHRA